MFILAEHKEWKDGETASPCLVEINSLQLVLFIDRNIEMSKGQVAVFPVGISDNDVQIVY